jgi:hypothetical protein
MTLLRIRISAQIKIFALFVFFTVHPLRLQLCLASYGYVKRCGTPGWLCEGTCGSCIIFEQTWYFQLSLLPQTQCLQLSPWLASSMGVWLGAFHLFLAGRKNFKEGSSILVLTMTLNKWHYRAWFQLFWMGSFIDTLSKRCLSETQAL